MNNAPLISIIIPTYNHGHFIGRCLRSVMGQTFKEWEAIVVNNFSTDNTVDIVNSFDDPRIKLVNFHNNGVIAASRNEGIGLAKGEYIAFLDSDDWWYENKLNICSSFFKSADVIYHDLDIYTANGRKIFKKIRGRRLKEPAFVDLMVMGNALPNSSVVARKTLLEKASGLNASNSFIAVEDFDLWLRLSKITNKFTYIPTCLGVCWIGDGNVSKLSERSVTRINTLFNAHVDSLPETARNEAGMYKNYIIGRVKQKMGLDAEAITCFKRSARSGNIIVKLKSMVCVARILISKKPRSTEMI